MHFLRQKLDFLEFSWPWDTCTNKIIMPQYLLSTWLGALSNSKLFSVLFKYINILVCMALLMVMVTHRPVRWPCPGSAWGRPPCATSRRWSWCARWRPAGAAPTAAPGSARSPWRGPPAPRPGPPSPAPSCWPPRAPPACPTPAHPGQVRLLALHLRLTFSEGRSEEMRW